MDREIHVWVLEGSNGQIVFDTEPNHPEDYCHDLEPPVKLYAVTALVDSAILVWMEEDQTRISY